MCGPVIQLCVGWEAGPRLAVGCSEPEPATCCAYSQGRLYVLVKPDVDPSSARGGNSGAPAGQSGFDGSTVYVKHCPKGLNT